MDGEWWESSIAPTAPFPFLTSGRIEALRAIGDLLSRLVVGKGSRVAITGEPGTGRTTLLDAAQAAARSRDVRVVRASPVNPFSYADTVSMLAEAPKQLLVLVDDVGDCGATTRHAARVAVESLATTAVAWIVVGDADAVRAVTGEFGPTLEIGEFDDDEAQSLFNVACGGAFLHPLPASVRPRPRHIVESARASVAAGAPVVWPDDLPAMLEGDLRSRIGGAALLGEIVDPRDVAALLDRPVGLAIGSVTAALKAGVYVEDGGELRFTHPLVRQSLLEGLDPVERRGLTRRALEMLSRAGAASEAAAGIRSGRLAAEDLDPATVLDIAEFLAGRDPETAAALLRATPAEASGREADLRAGRELSYRVQGGEPQAAADAIAILTSDPGPELAFAAAELMFPSFNAEARLLAARAVARDPGGPTVARLEAVILAADGYRGHATIEACRRVAELARDLDDERASDLVRIAQSLVECGRGNLAEALRQASLASTPPSGRGASPQWWITGIFRARILADLGRTEEARGLIASFLASAEGAGQLVCIPSLLMVRGMLEMERGGMAAGVTDLLAADALARAIGHPGLVQTNVANFLTRAAQMTGDAAELGRLRSALRAHVGHDEARRETAAGALMFAYDAVGAAEGVSEWADWAEKELAPQERPHYAMARGLDDSIARLRLAVRYDLEVPARRLVDSLRLLADRTEATLLTAAATHADGLIAGDPAAIRTAAATYREADRVLLAAQAWEDVAELEQSPTVQAEALRAAERLWSEAGAAREAARVARSLRDLGHRSAPWSGIPGLGLGLTSAEERVARAVAGGATNRQVAAALYISPSTVAVHLRRIFKKTGVGSRHELVELVRRGPQAPPSGDV